MLDPSQHIFDLHLFHQVHLGRVSAALGPLMQLEPSGEAPTLAKACGLKAWCWIQDFCLGDRKKTIPSTDRGGEGDLAHDFFSSLGKGPLWDGKCRADVTSKCKSGDLALKWGPVRAFGGQRCFFFLAGNFYGLQLRQKGKGHISWWRLSDSLWSGGRLKRWSRGFLQC